MASRVTNMYKFGSWPFIRMSLVGFGISLLLILSVIAMSYRSGISGGILFVYGTVFLVVAGLLGILYVLVKASKQLSRRGTAARAAR